MKRGIRTMTQIAKLARQAMGELDSAEDRQAATEIKLAAECVIAANTETRAPNSHLRSVNSEPHHD